MKNGLLVVHVNNIGQKQRFILRCSYLQYGGFVCFNSTFFYFVVFGSLVFYKYIKCKNVILVMDGIIYENR